MEIQIEYNEFYIWIHISMSIQNPYIWIHVHEFISSWIHSFISYLNSDVYEFI